MKVLEFENLGDYHFLLRFENGVTKKANLKNLISAKVKPNELGSTKIDYEWGCLEFNMVDIEPKTLYNFCMQNQ